MLPPSLAGGGSTRGHMKVPTSAVIVTLCLLALLPSCFSGPWLVTGSVQDSYAQHYGEWPKLDAAVGSVTAPIQFLVWFVAMGVDYVFVNTWYFWTTDAWSGAGTVYVHDVPTSKARVRSFLPRQDSGSPSSESEWKSK